MIEIKPEGCTVAPPSYTGERHLQASYWFTGVVSSKLYPIPGSENVDLLLYNMVRGSSGIPLLSNMVDLQSVRLTNSQRQPLVAVFTGSTSGIGKGLRVYIVDHLRSSRLRC